MDIEQTQRRAYYKWEAEGRPAGHHERHWHEAEEEARSSEDLPKRRSSDQSDVGTPPEGQKNGSKTSDAIASSKPGSFKLGELASENK